MKAWRGRAHEVGGLGVGVLLEDRLPAQGLAAGLSDAYSSLFFDLADQRTDSCVDPMPGLVAPGGDWCELELERFGETQLRDVLAAPARLVLGGAVEPEARELPVRRMSLRRSRARPLLGGVDEAYFFEALLRGCRALRTLPGGV